MAWSASVHGHAELSNELFLRLDITTDFMAICPQIVNLGEWGTSSAHVRSNKRCCAPRRLLLNAPTCLRIPEISIHHHVTMMFLALTRSDDAEATAASDRLEPGTHNKIKDFYIVPEINSQILLFRSTFSWYHELRIPYPGEIIRNCFRDLRIVSQRRE